MNSEEPLNPKIVLVINKQLNELLKKSPDGVNVIYNDLDILDLQADIEGPVDTPYYGGIFRCKLVISSEFPRSPPKGYFLTKIFHPNVSEKGEICVNTLKKDWDPKNWSLYNILEVIKCLMIFPFPESALNEEAAKLFMDNYQEYFKHAKLLTELYAFSKDKKTTMPSLTLNKTASVEPVFHSKTNTHGEFFSPFKSNNNNPLSTSLDIENFQSLVSGGKSKENTVNFSNQSNLIGFSNNNVNSQINDHSNNNEDVLTTVTNFSSLSSNIKQQEKYETANKKENEKKKWMKRI